MTEAIKENDKVTFDIQKGQKGWNAINVKLIK
jgi:cold shock CspA family protein